MLCIVIPVFNRLQFTRDCLDSLEKQTIKADKIIIVDDGSTDGTEEVLAEWYPDVVVLKGDGTLFWTASINMGIRHALLLGADQVMTLNNDTVASPTFIANMLKASRAVPQSLVGALDVDSSTKRPYYGGEILNWKWSTSKYLLDFLKKEEQRGLHEVSLFPARGLLIPKIVFDNIGLFDEERLPHYMADYDFTLTAARHGFKIYCNYDAVLYTYPEEGGDHKIRKKKSWSNYWKHLFNIKGGGNLVNYTRYTIKNCPPGSILAALFTGYTRRLFGFWLR
ncbi:MAG TPA: glycosyltransferase family 2 protein [Cyclobacteriaceae bacterium]|nr:glycosyltransferase family 2 protein [Cyclobacteriaceae bacterium]